MKQLTGDVSSSERQRRWRGGRRGVSSLGEMIRYDKITIAGLGVEC